MRTQWVRALNAAQTPPAHYIGLHFLMLYGRKSGRMFFISSPIEIAYQTFSLSHLETTLYAARNALHCITKRKDRQLWQLRVLPGRLSVFNQTPRTVLHLSGGQLIRSRRTRTLVATLSHIEGRDDYKDNPLSRSVCLICGYG
jgi:hypothetical protein